MTRLNVSFSNKDDGNMSFLYGELEEVRNNRARFLTGLGKTLEQSVFMATPHTDTIVGVSKHDVGRGMKEYEGAIEAEALVTQDTDLVLCFAPADCFPVIYHDPTIGVLALAHLGRKPAALHLAQNVVRYFIEQYGSNTADIRITIGPGIHASSYILTDPAQAQLPEWQLFLREVKEKTFEVDVLGFILNDLYDAGITPEQIDLSHTYDTAANLNQFSHFRSEKTDEREGRFLSCVWMEK